MCSRNVGRHWMCCGVLLLRLDETFLLLLLKKEKGRRNPGTIFALQLHVLPRLRPATWRRSLFFLLFFSIFLFLVTWQGQLSIECKLLQRFLLFLVLQGLASRPCWSDYLPSSRILLALVSLVSSLAVKDDDSLSHSAHLEFRFRKDTTRAPRPGEVNGKDYHFVTKELMQQEIAAGKFIESATFSGNMYGKFRSKCLWKKENELV